MTIILLVEGKTETALKRHLKRFLDERAAKAGRPKVALRTKPIDGQPGQNELRRRISLELEDPTARVVALIDVYPNYASAKEAKAFLRRAAEKHPRFYAHAAQYDVEAWLLPYWDDICRRLKVQKQPPGSDPEQVNRTKPPSKRLAELYRLAKPRSRSYDKATEMNAILRKKDLTVAANQCSEFKALLNTLLELGGLDPLE